MVVSQGVYEAGAAVFELSFESTLSEWLECRFTHPNKRPAPLGMLTAGEAVHGVDSGYMGNPGTFPSILLWICKCSKKTSLKNSIGAIFTSFYIEGGSVVPFIAKTSEGWTALCPVSVHVPWPWLLHALLCGGGQLIPPSMQTVSHAAACGALLVIEMAFQSSEKWQSDSLIPLRMVLGTFVSKAESSAVGNS